MSARRRAERRLAWWLCAPAVAAILSGDSEVAQISAASISRPFVQGNKDPVFIGGIKSLLTHSIIAKPDVKRPEQLKGK